MLQFPAPFRRLLGQLPFPKLHDRNNPPLSTTAHAAAGPIIGLRRSMAHGSNDILMYSRRPYFSNRPAGQQSQVSG